MLIQVFTALLARLAASAELSVCNISIPRCDICFSAIYCVTTCTLVECLYSPDYTYVEGGACGDTQCTMDGSCDYTRGDNFCARCVTGASMTNDRQCFCDDGWNADLDEIECCIHPCQRCSGDGYHHECGSCGSGTYLFLSKTCIRQCPTGWATSGSSCVLNTASIFQMTFDYNVVSTASEFSWGGIANFEYSFTGYGPWPIDKRGYYFSGSGSGTTIETYRVSPHFTLNMWVRPKTSSGEFFTRNNMKMGVVEGKPYMWVSCDGEPFDNPVEENIQATGNESIEDNWVYLSAEVAISSGGQTWIKLWMNKIYRDYQYTSSRTKIEDEEEVITLGSTYRGFLYYIRLYNMDGYHDDDFYALSNSTGDSFIFPSNCDSNYIVDGNDNCVPCDQECTVCATSDFLCTQCFDTLAATCNMDPAADKPYLWCTADEYSYFDAALDSVQPCSSYCKHCSTGQFDGCCECIDGYYFTGSLCHSYCPTGFTLSEDECIADDISIFHLKLSKIEGVVTDYEQDLHVLTGSSSVFHPNYDALDPYTSIDRGYYFHGNSVMQLPPNSYDSRSSFTLNSNLTVSAWIRPESGEGSLLTKQQANTQEESFTLSLENFYPKLTLRMVSGDISLVLSYTCQRATSSKAWQAVTITLSIGSDNISTAYCYLNGVSDGGGNYGARFFDDINLDYTVTIGGSRTSLAGTFDNFYTGFIYSLKLWNDIQSSDVDLGVACPLECESCPISNVCIPNCNINQYPDGCGCGNCHEDCVNGCRNPSDHCNLCESDFCLECSDYTGCDLKVTSLNEFCPAHQAELPDGSRVECSAKYPGCYTCSVTEVANLVRNGGFELPTEVDFSSSIPC